MKPGPAIALIALALALAGASRVEDAGFAAPRPVTIQGYDGVVMDPPRAGAEAQARVLAASRVPVIAYVSCDAASFARDAAILAAGGYRIGAVTPIDQFLWSSHIELVAGFVRSR